MGHGSVFVGLLYFDCPTLLALPTISLNECLLTFTKPSVSGRHGHSIESDLLNLYGGLSNESPSTGTHSRNAGRNHPSLLAFEGGVTGMLWAWLGINLALLGPNIHQFNGFENWKHDNDG